MSTSTRKRIARIAVCAVAVGVTVGLAPTASAATPAAPTGTTCYTVHQFPEWLSSIRYDADEQATMKLINDFRVRNGVPALRSDHKLSLAAGWMSNDNAIRGYSPKDHVDTLKREVGPRIQACGYTGYTWASEINYFGPGATPEQAFHWWTEKSEEHRAAILDPRVKAFGISVASKDGVNHYTVNMGDKQTYIKLLRRTGR
jgi:uncharacterized protein YkwD